MAALKGSEKQVRWAEEIKAAKITEMNAWLDEAAAEAGVSVEEREAMRAKILEVMEGQVYASWWIDKRGYEIDGFMAAMSMDARMGIGRDGKFKHDLPF